MKMLVVSNMFPDEKHPSYGTFVKKFTDEIEKLGIDYQLAVMHQATSKLKKIINYVFFYLGTFLKLVSKKYDVVYVHYASHSSIPVIWANTFKKLRIFINVHGSDVIPETHQQQRMQKNTRKILELSESIIVPSEYFKNVVENKYSPKGRIYIYPSGGIDPKLFYPYDEDKAKEARRKFGVDNGKPTIGMACRISQGKGWDTFIEAIDLLGEDKNKANFILVGSGPCERELEDLIMGKGLQKNINRYELLPQKDLADFYNALTFSSSSSRLSESLGLVIVEAMACGKPVISADFAADQAFPECC